MSQQKAILDSYREVANGDENAFAWLIAWHCYCHRIDDYIDEHKQDPEELLTILSNANTLFSMPFYQLHCQRISGVVQHVTNAYADSLHWEKSEGWKGQWGNVLRLCGIDMLMAVATICGGYEHCRKVSLQLREFSYKDQNHGE
jgi:hypothetical protein